MVFAVIEQIIDSAICLVHRLKIQKIVKGFLS